MRENDVQKSWTNSIIEKIISGADMHEINEEAMKHLMLTNPNGKMYKYRAFNKYALENLKGGTLFCASPSSFNDPFDCKFGISIQASVEESFDREISDMEQCTEDIRRLLYEDSNSEIESVQIKTLLKNKQFVELIKEIRESAETEEQMEEILYNNLQTVFDVGVSLLPECSVMKEHVEKGRKISADLLATLTMEQKKELLHGKANMLDYLKNIGVKGDVDEISAMIQLDKKYNPNNIANANEANRIINELEQTIVKNINSTYFVGSLCTDYKNRLMWSHYANSHKGFCIEYDFNVKCKERDELLMLPVAYTKERTKLPWSLTKLDEKEMIKLMLTRTVQALLTKDDAWSYENEWRVIRSNIKKPENIKMPPISCIYVGALCNNRNRAILCNIAKKLNIPIKQMRIDRGDYELRVSDIE